MFVKIRSILATLLLGVGSSLPTVAVDSPSSSPLFEAPALAQPDRTQRLSDPNAVPEGLSGVDWTNIHQQYERHRHRAIPVDGGHQARNPGQRWQTRFDGRGFITQPDNATWQWGLELRSYGFSGHERAVTPGSKASRVNAADHRVAYDWDDNLQEWFVNDRRGLEHGFTVKSRPAGTRSLNSHLSSVALAKEEVATLNFLFAVSGSLRPEVLADGRGVRFVDAHNATVLTYTDLTVLDATGRTFPAHFEAVTDGLRLAINERGAQYPLTIDPIAQQAYVKASNTGAGDQLFSVAVSGDTVVVGAYGEDSGALGVNGDQSDNSALDSGAVYVFVRNGTTWSQQAYLKASNTEAGDWFGESVAVAGDTIVVGAGFEDSGTTGVNGDQSDNTAPDSGAVYVFVRNGTTWSQQAYLKASNTDAVDWFGSEISISGDTVVITAYQEDSAATGVNSDESDNSALNSGAAYVFVRNGTNWSQQAYLKASNTGIGDGFGASVAVSGDTVVISANLEESAATGVNGDQTDNSAPAAGAAYVFERSGTNWSQQAYLKASNTETEDRFGYRAAVSGDTVVVAAFREASGATGVNGDQGNNNAFEAGAAYVFVRSGTNWSQQAYLKASNTAPPPAGQTVGDRFGRSVAMSGDTIVVGAAREDSNATGVNVNGSNNSALDSGAAYVFVRSGTNWSQQAYLKASNTGAGDTFGMEVAISGDTVVVSAVLEDSNATGVNGNGSNNSALDSGAAYIFTGVGVGPRLTLGPDATGGYFIRFNGAPDVTYRLQRAPSVTGSWDTIDTQTAPASGLVEYHETNPSYGQTFYRVVQP